MAALSRGERVSRSGALISRSVTGEGVTPIAALLAVSKCSVICYLKNANHLPFDLCHLPFELFLVFA